MKKYTVILLCALVLVVISGCAEKAEKTYHTYQLQDGTIMECAYEEWGFGTLREISDCKDGSVIYNPMNIRKIS